MSIEKPPDSMNKRHYARRMLPLTLSVSGGASVAGLARQAIQFALVLTLFMFSGNAMANNREHQQIALVGTWTIFRMRLRCRNRRTPVKASIVWRLMATAH
ncbi:hypothetical protein ACRS8K_00375 [Serratia marcescens]